MVPPLKTAAGGRGDHRPLVVVAPNAFKGTLSAVEAGAAMVLGLKQGWPGCQIRSCPMADGGDGTLDILLAASRGVEVVVRARDAMGAPCMRRYGRFEGADGTEVVIEAAQVVGLNDAPGQVEQRTTAGLGDLVRHALDAGARRFVIGLGGTSTNDAGAGFLEALGARFLDPGGRALAPSPQALLRVHALDLSLLDARVRACTIHVLTDVSNPLVGPDGATLCYGPQKGMPADGLRAYDEALGRIARLYERETGHSCIAVPGSGAAGGLGAALLALGATLGSGAEVVARRVGLHGALKTASWVLTGEGCTDRQTLQGKVPWVVARVAREAGVDCALISGRVEPAVLPVLRRRFAVCRDLMTRAPAPEEIHARAFPLLVDVTREVAAVWAVSN